MCETLPRVRNATEVVVLQHPHERRHPIGTARLVRRALEQVRLYVVAGSAREGLHAEVELADRAALLYPHPSARCLESIRPDERPDQLVVLDGTWSQAKSLYRDNSWLHDLPHVCLTPDAPSVYRIRREPSEVHVSTLEAIVHALALLEPGLDGLDELRDAFIRMIDLRIAARARRFEPRSRRRKRTVRSALPPRFSESLERVVCVHGETVQKALRRDPRVPELLHWVAVRAATGEVFDEVTVPARPPRDEHLELVGLDRRRFEGALSPDAMHDAWWRFCRETDVFVAWNDRVAPLLHSYCAQSRTGACGRDASLGLIDGRRPLAVRPLLARVGLPCSGRIEEVLAVLELASSTSPSRARRRLEATRAVLDHVVRVDDAKMARPANMARVVEAERPQ
ncbi:MAG: DTW domain-containing protein, partial [Planctomycetes bacterium]|nr:DTW domain-containing protein [Planctomycetota bacterium]